MSKLIVLFVLVWGLALAQGQIRFAQMSPGAPAVDLWINGHLALSKLNFKTVTPYIPTPTGLVTVWITPSGSNEPKLADSKFTLIKGQKYTLAALGYYKSMRARLLLDDIAVPQTGRTWLRVVHASPDTPALNIYAVVPMALHARPLLVIRRIAFGNVTRYISFRAGHYTFQTRLAGTLMGVLTQRDTLLAGNVYTLFVYGSQKNLGAVMVLDKE